MRNFIATLLLSQGVPMIRGGDEICHTQQGNNNPYCQDTEINWLNWDLVDSQRAFRDFVRQMIRLRRKHPVLRRRQFFQGRQIRGDGATDILWLTPSGREMQDADWDAESSRVFGVQLNGKMIDEVDERGRPILGRTLLITFNAEDEDADFVLPELPNHQHWRALFDTASTQLRRRRLAGGYVYRLTSRSVALFALTTIRPKFLARLFRRAKSPPTPTA
jgi:glycogen operon protein